MGEADRLSRSALLLCPRRGRKLCHHSSSERCCPASARRNLLALTASGVQAKGLRRRADDLILTRKWNEAVQLLTLCTWWLYTHSQYVHTWLPAYQMLLSASSDFAHSYRPGADQLFGLREAVTSIPG